MNAPLQFGLGWREDLPDERDRDFAFGTLSLGDGPESADLRQYIVSLLHQDGLPSCVAQSVPQAIRIVHKRENPSAEPPLTSRFFTWYYARLQHGDQRNKTGTYVRVAVKVLNRLGLPPEELWPQVLTDLDDERPTYTKRPPPNVSMAAFDNRKVKYHRIYETGEARKFAVKACIAAGKPVVFGTDVGYSFLEPTGPTRNIEPPINEAIAGGHAMVIVAYDSEGCWICNSWGSGWRAGGMVHVSWDYILWSRTRDLWAFDV